MEKIKKTIGRIMEGQSDHLRGEEPEYFIDGKFDRAAYQAYLHDKRIKNLLKFSGIPKKFLPENVNRWVDDPEMGPVLKAINNFKKDINHCVSAGTWLLLKGKTGTGKTRLVSDIVYHANTLGIEARFINDYDLSMVLNNRNFDQQQYVNEYVDIMKSLPLLAIDELGRGFYQNNCIDRLWAIIDYRYRESKATLFTTNFDTSQLIQKIDYHFVGRIIENCGKENVIKIPDSVKNFRIKGGV